MAKEMTPLDVTDTPDLLRLAEEVARTGVARVLRRDSEELAVIRPVSTSRGRSRTRPTREAPPNAWLEGLVGAAESAGPADISANIHAYVAEATQAEGHQPHQR
jgi:hypothetical protein